MKICLPGILALLCLLPAVCLCQDQKATDQPSTTDKVINFPSKLFGKIQQKTTSLDQQLTNQTEKYLQKLAKRETRLKKKLYKIDSTAANQLFSNSIQQKYASFSQKISQDTGGRAVALSGEYLPYIDSLKGSLSFLQQNPQLLNGAAASSAAFKNSMAELQQLQAKMQDADQIKAFIQQRKQQIGAYIAQHTSLQGVLGSQYQALNQDLYYYSQQVRQYKEMLNNPDELEQKALTLLNQVPAFQQFMKNNSQLAGLFNLPGGYANPSTALNGLQTLSQVQNLIQGQLASGGPSATAALQSNLQSAQQQLDQFKNKLSQLGGGSGDIDMPDFKPNEQKTRTFLKRLEWGTNLQTTSTSYYFPTMTDIGLSLGYKLNNTSTVGVGASYKIGWGSAINHISVSSQGAGLRSFLDYKIKHGFSATGGFEYNYTTPIVSLQQLRNLSYWTQSGLIGLSKTVAVKSRVMKQTRLQLLWDFLSYEQVPKTQPVVFRVGYNF